MPEWLPFVIGGGILLLLVLLPLLARGGRVRTERSRVSGWRTRAGGAAEAGSAALAAVRSGAPDAADQLKSLNTDLHALAATPPDPECASAVNDFVAATRGLRTAIDEDRDVPGATTIFESSLERLRSLAS